MTKIRQILRSFTQGKSKVQISEQTGSSRNTVKKYIRKFLAEKMTFDMLSGLTDTELLRFQTPPYGRRYGLKERPSNPQSKLTCHVMLPHQ